MTNRTRIFLIILCSILIAACAVGMVFAGVNYFGNKNKAYAEFTDLANTNTLVNFNQLLQSNGNLRQFALDFSYSNGYLSINGTSEYPGGDRNIYSFFTAVNLDNTHKYYLCSRSNEWEILFYGGGPSSTTSQTTSIFEPTNTASYSVALRTISADSIAYGTTINQKFGIFVIDLTLMFGAGNEPTLEQANNYFTADTYAYNSGTVMPFSKDYLQGYQDGANDLLESMTITYNQFTIGASSSTYANTTIDRGELIFDSTYGTYLFSGVIGIDLMGIVERGTYFDIDFILSIADMEGESDSYAQNFKLHFAYVDQNNNLVEIIEMAPEYLGSWQCQYKGSFVLPITTQKIFCYVNYNTVGNNSTPTQCISIKSSITFKSTDMGLLMNNAYQRGYEANLANWTQGGENWNNVWTMGYNAGLAQQNATLGTMEYIGAAFSGIGEILQIELLPGVPFSLFILLPLMFGLIAFVVKLSKGGS